VTLKEELLYLAMINGVEELVTKLDNYTEPRYAKNGDPLHSMLHIRQVALDGLRLVNWGHDGNLNIPHNAARLVVVAAYYHDWYTAVNRHDHHLLARDMILRREGICLDIFSDSDIHTIAMAVQDHRASSTPDVFYNDISAILACADRGAPHAGLIIDRVMLTGNISCKLLSHILEKYGPNGYVKYPSRCIDYYGAERILNMRTDIENWVKQRREAIKIRSYT